MIKKILIANRGEIACRVMRSAKKMGIATVAVYSDADADAVHTKMADEAYYIGASPTNQSYLAIDKIITAIKATGADAVHPGYGFLSENQEFAKRLKAENIIFIGPPVNAVSDMGDKISSKKLAIKAGVSCVPGVNEPIKDPADAVKIAQQIGYPVMLKASAGGGGKGMRLAFNDQETISGLQSAMNEAKSSFGDDRVFIEKFIQEPHHIEIQILGDQHGNIIYCGERECSLQRRHQKVIEEAPSPFISAQTRQKMGEQAVALARAVGYFSAGTVEFIVDKDQNFYFLEMNTRLQVEHPITEAITGLDLVEWMIRIARGEKLAFSQDDIKLTGHAIEARVYAEDPTHSFLPSIGRLSYYLPPKESAHIRVDTGVSTGSEISIYYDPMIAKLIAYGANRDEAIAHIRQAMNGYGINGVAHNLAFLQHLIAHPRFKSGITTTNFIAEEYPDGLTAQLQTPKNPDNFVRLAMVISAIIENLPKFSTHELIAFVSPDDSEIAYQIQCREGLYLLSNQNQENIAIETAWHPNQLVMNYRQNGTEYQAIIHHYQQNITISQDGLRLTMQIMPARIAPQRRIMLKYDSTHSAKEILAPMPGVITRIAVKIGDNIKAGQEIATMEAMKMENILRATHDGEIKIIHTKIGEAVKFESLIMELA